MARQVGFHFYSFKVWQKYTSELETLSSLRGREDVLSLLNREMTQLVGTQRNDAAAKRMACVRRVDLTGRFLTGLIEAGGYGETANIVQSRTGALAHRQRADEASMLPTFFRLHVPQNVERGVLILQKDNRVPAKQALQTLFSGILHGFDELLTTDLTPVANRATFERLVNDGEVQELRFIKTSIPQDFVDAYDRGRDETRGSVELSYRASRGASLPIKRTLTRWLRGNAEVRDQYEIPGLDFDFDTVKAEIRIGKKLQTVDFGRRLTNPIVDVTDQVTWDNRTGHPTYESLLDVSAELAEDEALTAYGD